MINVASGEIILVSVSAIENTVTFESASVSYVEWGLSSDVVVFFKWGRLLMILSKNNF